MTGGPSSEPSAARAYDVMFCESWLQIRIRTGIDAVSN